VRGINRYGRASQGVRVMNIRDDDQVSAVALVAESDSSEVADDLDQATVPGVLVVDDPSAGADAEDDDRDADDLGEPGDPGDPADLAADPADPADEE